MNPSARRMRLPAPQHHSRQNRPFWAERPGTLVKPTSMTKRGSCSNWRVACVANAKSWQPSNSAGATPTHSCRLLARLRTGRVPLRSPCPRAAFPRRTIPTASAPWAMPPRPLTNPRSIRRSCRLSEPTRSGQCRPPAGNSLLRTPPLARIARPWKRTIRHRSQRVPPILAWQVRHRPRSQRSRRPSVRSIQDPHTPLPFSPALVIPVRLTRGRVSRDRSRPDQSLSTDCPERPVLARHRLCSPVGLPPTRRFSGGRWPFRACTCCPRLWVRPRSRSSIRRTMSPGQRPNPFFRLSPDR